MDFRELLASILQPNAGQVQVVQQALDVGWLAERSEEYERAFAAFEQAIQRAQAGQHDVSLLTASALMAQLHQAEIRLRQGRGDDAEALAQSALDGAHGHTQRAYATCMIGVLAQAKGDWAAARAAYEQALDYARDCRSAGRGRARARSLGRNLSARRQRQLRDPFAARRAPEAEHVGRPRPEQPVYRAAWSGADPERAGSRRTALDRAGAADCVGSQLPALRTSLGGAAGQARAGGRALSGRGDLFRSGAAVIPAGSGFGGLRSPLPCR